MRKRPLEQVWKTALAVLVLAATLMALYAQLFERRSSEEEARLYAWRLEDALAESRARLRAEILADLRAELAREEGAAEEGGQPAPDTVLRRLEAGDASGGLAQALSPLRPEEALVIARLDALSRKMEESDRALRRDLEELRAATRQEANVSRKTLSLVLAALVPLVLYFLSSLWQPRDREPAKDAGKDGATEP